MLDDSKSLYIVELEDLQTLAQRIELLYSQNDGQIYKICTRTTELPNLNRFFDLIIAKHGITNVSFDFHIIDESPITG